MAMVVQFLPCFITPVGATVSITGMSPCTLLVVVTSAVTSSYIGGTLSTSSTSTSCISFTLVYVFSPLTPSLTVVNC